VGTELDRATLAAPSRALAPGDPRKLERLLEVRGRDLLQNGGQIVHLAEGPQGGLATRPRTAEVIVLAREEGVDERAGLGVARVDVARDGRDDGRLGTQEDVVEPDDQALSFAPLADEDALVVGD